METRLKIETTAGDIVVKLYNETPKHRDNFIKLAKEGTSFPPSSFIPNTSTSAGPCQPPAKGTM